MRSTDDLFVRGNHRSTGAWDIGGRLMTIAMCNHVQRRKDNQCRHKGHRHSTEHHDGKGILPRGRVRYGRAACDGIERRAQHIGKYKGDKCGGSDGAGPRFSPRERPSRAAATIPPA